MCIFYFQEEQAVLEKIVRERRASLAPSAQHAANLGPHILVSEPSVGDFGEEPFLYIAPRRSSTQSMGPVVVPVSLSNLYFPLCIFNTHSIHSFYFIILITLINMHEITTHLE